MATVKSVLANNPFMDRFNSIIAELNANDNPFQAALVANLLYTRMVTWGQSTMPYEPPPDFGRTGGKGAVIANTNYQKNPKVGVSVIRMAARDLRMKDPYTPSIQAFKQYLDGISMNTSNAWIDFNIAVNVFYEVIDPISYFMHDYLDGAYEDLFLDIMGLYKRPGAAGNGLTLEQGVEGTAEPAVSETIIIHIDTMPIELSKLHNRWFGLYDNVSQLYVYYFDYGKLGGWSGVGGSFSERKVVVDENTSRGTALGRLKAAIEADGRYTVGNPVDNAVTLTATTPGPINDFNTGTIGIHNGAGTNMASAGDASSIDTVAANDYNVWKTKNNSLRAVYDAAFDAEFFLESIYDTPLLGVKKKKSLQVVYRHFPYNIETATMGYNQPGVQFADATKKVRSKTV